MISNEVYLNILEDVLKSSFKGHFLFEKNSFAGTLNKSDIDKFIHSIVSSIDDEIQKINQ